MVTRTNGAPRQGYWFSADVRILTITTDNSAWLADLTIVTTDPRQADVPNSALEQVLELASMRGTVIGVTAIDADTLHVMVDYGQAYDPADEGLGNAAVIDVELELVTAINAIATPIVAANTTVVITNGFAGAVQGTPT